MNVRLAALLAAIVAICSPAHGGELEDIGRAVFLGRDHDPMLKAGIGAAPKTAPASIFGCANCHGRDAAGGGEGLKRAPSIRWATLAPPVGDYDIETFRRAVIDGVRSDGQPLARGMPRFELDEFRINALKAYLASVDGEQRRGVSSDAVRFAVATDGAKDPYPELVMNALKAAPEVFGRRVVAIPLAVNASDEELMRLDIVAVLGAPASAVEFGKSLLRAGVPSYAPRALLTGDESPADVIGVLPTLDQIGQATFDRAKGCAAGRPLALVGDDPISKRLASAMPKFGTNAAEVVEINTLKDLRSRLEGNGCVVIFADPAMVSKVTTATDRMLVGLVDQFGPAVVAVGQARRKLALANPRLGVARDQNEMAQLTANTVIEALRRTGRTLNRASLMSALKQVTSARSQGSKPDANGKATASKSMFIELD